MVDGWRGTLAAIKASVSTTGGRQPGPAVLGRLVAAWAFVTTAASAASVALTLAAYATGGVAGVGVVLVIRTLPSVLAGSAAGLMLARVGPRRTLLVASLCGGATAAASAAVTSVALLAVLAVGLSFATTAYRAGHATALAAVAVTAPALTAANGVSAAAEAAGLLLGPLVALTAGTGAFLAVAALFLLPVFLLPAMAAGPRMAPSVRTGTGRVSDEPVARSILALVLVQTVGAGGLAALYPVLAQGLRLGPQGVGLLAAGYGAGGLLASVVVLRLAGSRRLGSLTALGLGLYGAALLAVGALPPPPVAIGLVLLIGGGNCLFDVTSVTLLQRGVSRRLLGRALGAVETVVVVGFSVGAAAAPLLTRRGGLVLAASVLGGLLLLAALARARALRRLDHALLPPTAVIGLLQDMPAFRVLPPLALERLALSCRPYDAAPEDVLATQGESAQTYWVVGSGRLVVDVDGASVATLYAGDGFGEIALLHACPRTATVRAVEPSRLYILHGADYLQALAHGPAAELAQRTADDRLRQSRPRGE